MFRWARNLWRSYTTEPEIRLDIETGPLNTDEVVNAVVNHIEHTGQLTGTVTLGHGTDVGGFFGGAGGAIAGIGQIDYGQQQQQMAAQYQAQQQAYAYNHQVFNEGTYGQLRQQQQMNQLFSNYDTFLIELKANGMPEPDIKQGDLLGVEKSYLIPVMEKLKAIASSSNANNRKYGKMYEQVCHMRSDQTTKFKGDWGYDETLGEYIIATSYCTQHLPLSIFMKLPQTMAECIEVMEKTIWSSRKSPITKKDIL